MLYCRCMWSSLRKRHALAAFKQLLQCAMLLEVPRLTRHKTPIKPNVDAALYISGFITARFLSAVRSWWARQSSWTVKWLWGVDLLKQMVVTLENLAHQVPKCLWWKYCCLYTSLWWLEENFAVNFRELWCKDIYNADETGLYWWLLPVQFLVKLLLVVS